jgi:hypothetical protein
LIQLTRSDFYKKYYSVAVAASNYMPIDKRLSPDLLLAVMSWETADATNRGATSLNNLSGIKYSEYAASVGAVKDGMYAKYPSLDAYARDFARVMSNSVYYSGIHSAAKTPGFEDDIIAWNKSAYAEADYNVGVILGRIQEIKGVIGDGQAVGTLNLSVPDVKNMSQDKLLQYAALGAAVLALVAISK